MNIIPGKITKIAVLFFLIMTSLPGFAQEVFTKDIDGDAVSDSIYVEGEHIHHKLSTQNFVPITIANLEIYGEGVGISETKNGFEYGYYANRAGVRIQCRYNLTIEKIEVIGMSRYEFGNAANDGSGESSVNILTGDYIGNWKYYDMETSTLIELPSIKTKIKLSKIDITELDYDYIETYTNKCSDLYYTHKKEHIRTKVVDKEYNIYLQTVEEDIVYKKVPFNEIPSFMDYKGHPKNAVHWSDSQGIHYLLMSETGVYTPSDSEDHGANAELFAYHYLKTNNTPEKQWSVYDYIKDCPVEIEAAFIKNTLHITDLDNDGIKEIWLMYRKVCHGDVSPLEMKIIMYEGTQKHGMRGHNKIQLTATESYGGEYKFDANFKNAPTVFRSFAKKMWNQHLIHNWDD